MMDAAVASEEFKMTELGLLPKEWQVNRLTDAAQIIMGQSPPGSSYNGSGNGMPFLQGKAEFGNLFPKHVKYTTQPLKIGSKGSVLMSVRAPVGDVNIADIDYCIGRGLASIFLRKGNNTYLFYSLTYRKADIEKEGTGSTFKAINKTKVEDFKIALPPLPEQEEIAAVLSTVQKAKEKTEAVIKATNELKKSLMKHLFAYGPVPLAETANVPLKETEIGLVPKGWDVLRLGDVAGNLIGGGTPSTSRSDYWGGEIHWTTSKRIDGIHIFDGEKRITPKGLEESSTHLIPKGNLIIGTRVGVGKVAINEVDMAISQDLTGAFIDKSKYIIEFLAYQICTDEVQRVFEKCMRGTTIKGIPRDELAKILLKIPPVHIQKQIADLMSALDKKIEADENRSKALEDLFQTLLSNLMTGKIRVNQLEVMA
jgi:type I restriction enzyme S subunit